MTQRHATAEAVNEICRWFQAADDTFWRKACDWESLGESSLDVHFHAQDAARLLGGHRVEMPSCPSCGALLDLALECRP